ncbi:MAG: flagellar biosynthetic protein FliO [Planctomycetota bacterium]|nr:flagellar biosynthetic protein FliO [Planctomycetota bacterium]
MLTPTALKKKSRSRIQVRFVLILAFSLVTVSLAGQQWPTVTTGEAVEVNSVPDTRLANGGVIATDAMGGSDAIWRMFQAIGLIIAIAGVFIGGFSLLKRFAPGVIPGTDSRMKVLTRMPIGNRQSMIIVKVGERVLVVGASPGRIDCLSEITDYEEVQDLSYGFEFSSEVEKVKSEVEDEAYQVVNVGESSSEDVRNEIQWLRDRLDGYGDRVERETQA